MPLIPTKNYCENSILDSEYKSFEDLWTYVGLKSEIPKKFDYFLYNVGLKSLNLAT